VGGFVDRDPLCARVMDSDDDIVSRRVFATTIFILVVDVFVYSLVLPFYPAVLGDSMDDTSWLRYQALSNLTSAFAGSVVGGISDWFGRRFVLIGSQIFSLMCAGMLTFGAWKLQNGDSKGAVFYLLMGFVLRKMNRSFPICCSIVTDITRSRHVRNVRLSRLSAASGLGFALGPAIVGYLSKLLEIFELFTLGACGAAFGVLLSFIGFNDVHEHSKKHRTSTEEENLSSLELIRKLLDPRVLIILSVHCLSSLAQFAYITTIGKAASRIFKLDTAMYGSLVSFFGIAYSVSTFFVLPVLLKSMPEKQVLLLGLLVSSAARFVISIISDWRHLYIAHVFMGIGTGSISCVVTSITTRTGKKVGLTGSIVGVEDSLRRLAGVVAPLLVSMLPPIYHLSSNQTLFVGSFVSGAIYFSGFILALFIPSEQVHVKKKKLT